MTDKNSGYDNIYKSVTLYSLSIFQIKTVFLVVLQSGNAVLICAIRKINRKKVWPTIPLSQVFVSRQ